MSRAIRVRGRERPTMPGVHGLEHVERLAATNLANDDPIGSHPERRTQERADVDGPSPFDARWSRLEADEVRLRQPELCSIFDGHDSLGLTHGERERVERARPPAAVPASDEDGPSSTDG